MIDGLLKFFSLVPTFRPRPEEEDAALTADPHDVTQQIINAVDRERELEAAGNLRQAQALQQAASRGVVREARRSSSVSRGVSLAQEALRVVDREAKNGPH